MMEAPAQQIQSETAMRSAAAALALTCHAGDVLALVGDLGAGKTRFVGGFADGMDFKGEVTSPTFTLAHEYRGGRLPLIHVDLYRLENPPRLWEAGWEEWLEGNGVVLVEWADRFPELMPTGTFWIGISILGEFEREVVAAPSWGRLQERMRGRER